MLKHSGIKPEVIKEIIDKKGARVYMIGIGGVSMSALSRELLRRGAIISGSDSGSPERCLALRERGVEISSVHSREHLEGFCPELVVYTLAGIARGASRSFGGRLFAFGRNFRKPR